ncbi:hypothetical protein [Phyllobacterium myrsinacearum]|uniref:General secretion pathway protein K n=1 Tax=Phyllobacterium myrsinacearum TaxID=28101 RepID=A0A839EWY0_9HYPH|nr:hypothetical protein [Phyllobacterium myrsinacearum]MBA8882024.1 general secretion pathway protein K [Phyllobacterium myrsinacearum]
MHNRVTETPDPNAEYSEAGFALPAVLGFLLILSAVLIPFASSARIRALTAGNQYDDTRLGLVLNAVNAMVAGRLAKDRRGDENSPAYATPTRYHCALGRGSVEVQFQEHSGLIDLNVASIELLQLGLGAAGAPSSTVRELAQTITQFRRLDGDRTAAVPPQMIASEGLKFAPFEDVAELYDFLPLRSIALSQLMRVFTVNSRSAVVTGSSLSPAIKSKLSTYPEAAKAIVATATQGADFVTVESILHDGAASHYEAGIYQIGASGTGAVRLINSLPSDTAALPEVGAVTNGCSQILDSKATALLGGVF